MNVTFQHEYRAAILLTSSFLPPGARGFEFSQIRPDALAGIAPSPGLNALVTWTRDLSKDPDTFEFVWMPIGSTDIQRTGVSVNVTAQPTIAQGALAILPYPAEGLYHLAIFGVPGFSDRASEPLLTSSYKIKVEPAVGSAVTSSIELSTTPTTATTSGLWGSILTPSLTLTSTTNDRPGRTSISRPSVPTTSESSATDTEDSDSLRPSTTQTSMLESFTSSEHSDSSLPSSATVKNQPSDSSQAHRPTSFAVVPIVAGTIGGVLTVVVVVFAVQCYLRERCSGTQTLDVNPFLTQVSRNRAVPPDTHDTSSQQGSAQPSIIQTDIGALGVSRDPETQLEPPPPVSLENVENTCSATIASAARNNLERPNVVPATPFKPEMGVFTTDELVVELKQRMREEGRWERDESLPGYPESDQGTSHP
ncbi:hypothetical protein PQX77_014480 [Marasmius sp. AFHP31]|nr:hypothetical protein PQX77_014480 [Marasmius sp. AFHP31]